MGIVQSTPIVPTNIWEKGQDSESDQNSESLSSAFGRSVTSCLNEAYETIKEIDKIHIRKHITSDYAGLSLAKSAYVLLNVTRLTLEASYCFASGLITCELTSYDSSGLAGDQQQAVIAQKELNLNPLEMVDLSGQNHCQFYADCKECHLLQTEPGTVDKTPQTLQINESEDQGSGNTVSQENHYDSEIF
ncbi:hypothetical protein [Endozoicomonas sp.]|uniref:hypothetical protein n=1 Tax=Endozoicomonas sp. TaxID=1892382 RepID=UPI002883C5FC|nr:hypothetical protein [Endozoicomonas sp.]